MAVSIKSILNTLNTHNYSDLSVFLQDTDWSGLTPATIVPKKEMRKFVKAIEDREVRLAVMKFLYDYTDAYFFEKFLRKNLEKVKCSSYLCTVVRERCEIRQKDDV